MKSALLTGVVILMSTIMWLIFRGEAWWVLLWFLLIPCISLDYGLLRERFVRNGGWAGVGRAFAVAGLLALFAAANGMLAHRVDLEFSPPAILIRAEYPFREDGFSLIGGCIMASPFLVLMPVLTGGLRWRILWPVIGTVVGFFVGACSMAVYDWAGVRWLGTTFWYWGWFFGFISGLALGLFNDGFRLRTIAILVAYIIAPLMGLGLLEALAMQDDVAPLGMILAGSVAVTVLDIACSAWFFSNTSPTTAV